MFHNTVRTLLLATLALAAGTVQAAESDAISIDQNLQARHFPFGTVLDPINASATSTQITGYTRCGDSALWTGAYLAAESFRYKVTQSPDALANLNKALAGLKSLVDVTGNNLLARCLVPLTSPYAAGIQSEEAANGIYMNTSAGYFWVGNTSRDEYTGAIFGLAVAYDMVDDPATKAAISDLVSRIVGFLTGHNWSVVMPDGSSSTTFLIRPDELLTLLQVGKHVNPGKFSDTYDLQKTLLSFTVSIPIAVDVLDDNSYFKFNLDYMSFYNLIRLETGSKSSYQDAYSSVRKHTASHQNAFFDVVDRAINGPNTARDAEAQTLLDQWLLRPRRDLGVDLTNTVPVCNGQACTPIPVPLRVPTDYLWQRSPFQLTGGGSGLIEGAGVDYLLPYWMSRFYSGTSASFVVQPAAAAGAAVGPESIASLFGANLASQTASAAGLPLPVSLGGVSLSVTDSAGTARMAPLIYVSPGQINFEVPAGTAAGAATFTITNGATTLSATGTVQIVAPALFSENGNGMGVAAASAIQTIAPNPQPQFPIPVFQCSASGCVSTPISLGIDTPVYLTLYGTGIRNRTSLSNVLVTINGISVPVLYAGPQPEFPGLDQVNVGLTLNLHGSGESNVVLTVDGQTSNTVTVNIR